MQKINIYCEFQGVLEVQVKMKPEPELLTSMAMRIRHDFGLMGENEQAVVLMDMQRVWEEVVGLGYYQKKL